MKNISFQDHLDRAIMGNVESQNQVGKMYFTGTEVRKNYKEAFKWFQLSAAQRDIVGMYNLASMLDIGVIDIEKNHLDSKIIYENVLEFNEDFSRKKINLSDSYLIAVSSSAQNLGLLYYNGKCGTPRDYMKAFKYFALGAEMGDKESQYSVGVLFYKGKGIKINYKEAIKWWRLSSNQGYELAQQALGQKGTWHRHARKFIVYLVDAFL